MDAFRDLRVVRSPPLTIEWAGFAERSDVLQLHGWEFAIEHHLPGSDSYKLLMRHPGRDVVGYASFDVSRSMAYYRAHLPDTPIRVHVREMRMSNQAFFVRVDRPPKAVFARVNMEPMVEDLSEKRLMLSDTGIFRPWRTDGAEEIIVEPATVMSLLEQIKGLQAPELAAARERRRREAARQQYVERVAARIITVQEGA